MENVLAIITMRIKMYALGVTCSRSPLFNLDVFIFAEVIKSKVIDKRGFFLTMENICLSQKQHPTADRIQNESQTELR